jgi:PadR family transcriptional regulator PadR
MQQVVAARLSRLVEPALLYLLGHGAAAHGYDLLSEVNAMGLTDTPVDPAAIYRTLRQLEAEGAVVSTWDTSGAGPARRNYELTPLGWARLAAWADVIERRAEAMRSFVSDARKLLKSKS